MGLAVGDKFPAQVRELLIALSFLCSGAPAAAAVITTLPPRLATSASLGIAGILLILECLFSTTLPILA